MNRRKTSKDPASPPDLILSGDRMGRQLVCWLVGDQPIQLTHACCAAVVDLLAARLGDGTGFVTQDPVIMSRTRDAFDLVRPGLGHQLLPKGTGGQYRFGWTDNQIRKHVILVSTFCELVDHGIVARESAEVLEQNCKFLKSKRNRKEIDTREVRNYTIPPTFHSGHTVRTEAAKGKHGRADGGP